MKPKFTLILFYITVLSIPGFSQTGKSVVIGTMVNKPNAVLVLNPPDGNQGFLLPQVTTATRLSIVPASPSEDGLVVFDITDKAFYFWKDGQWNKGLGGSQTLTYDQLSQKLSISNGNVVDLATLKEIPSVSGQAGKYITTDGTTLSWATLSSLGIAGGDLAGSYPIPTIAAIAGNNIGTAINTSASAGSIIGSKINPNFGSQNITTSGNITSTGTGALTIAGVSTLNGTLAVTGATTLSNLGGGTNMVVAGPSGLLSTQPIPATIIQGNLTTATTGLAITGGTNAVIGSGSTINIQNATGAQPGLLTAADFTTFNNKVGMTTAPAVGNISGSFSTGLQIVPGSANQVLITNGSTAVQWVNPSTLAGAQSLTGDVTGALNANTVTKLQGINLSTTSPTDQQVLQYDNATSRWRPATVASITPTAFKMRQTLSQTINGTEMLIWDDEQYDDGGNNFFSNVFHVPSTGLYHFDAIVTFQNVDKSNNVEVILRVAGADVHRAYGNTGQDDTDVSVSISTDIKLNAGDQVTLWGVTQNNRQTAGNPVRTQFSGRKVY